MKKIIKKYILFIIFSQNRKIRKKKVHNVTFLYLLLKIKNFKF